MPERDPFKEIFVDAEAKEKVEFEEKSREILLAIKDCHKNFLPLLEKTSVEPNETNWESLVEASSKNVDEIFSESFYDLLMEDKLASSAARHDFGNVAHNALGLYVRFVNTKNGCNKENKIDEFLIKRGVDRLAEFGPAYLFILEDLLIRRLTVNGQDRKIKNGLNDDDIKLKKEIIRPCKLNEFCTVLCLEMAYDDNKKIDFSHVKKDLKLSNDEEMQIIPGMLVNAIYNIGRNAVKDRGERSAKKAFVAMAREGDEIVLRVSNDGSGLPKERIKKDNRESSVYAGKSYEKGTGWGLSSLPDRMVMAGTKLNVWSRMSDGVWHDAETQKEGEQESVPPFESLKDSEGESHNLNVIFEIRIPITKKTK